MRKFLNDYGFLAALPFIFLFCDVIRPPLPVDETRYLTVAWEIWLSQDWIHLTYNFEPYHHKPPLLFWLINVFWSFMGTTQLAASLPGIIASVFTVVLSGRLAEKLFPDDALIARKTMLLVMGCLPFLIYAPLIRFDIMMAMWCVAVWLLLLEHAAQRRFLHIVGIGLCMGMGVLTKGPVVYIYTLVPALLAPLWMQPGQKHSLWKWYGGVLAAVLISGIPVSFWLMPLILEADDYFLYWLLWKQSAGRITGSFDNAHIRPLYFYLPFVPLYFMPWILFPGFWHGLIAFWKQPMRTQAFKFMGYTAIPVFVLFSLITGKQIHYLVPLIPIMMIFAAFMLSKVQLKTIQITLACVFAVYIGLHLYSLKTIMHSYDWQPIANIVAANADKDIAYVRNYNGEFGYMARLTKPIYSTDEEGVREWFKVHPDGIAVIRYKDPKAIRDLEMIYAQSYRVGGYVGVFKAKNSR